METMIELACRRRHSLFTVALFLFIIGAVFSEANGIGDYLCQSFTLNVGELLIQKSPISYYRAGILGLLLIKIALDLLDHYKLSFFQILILVLVVAQALISHGRGLLFLFVFAIAAHDVDIKLISKVLLLTLSASIGIVAFLALGGFIEEIISEGGEWYRTVRRSLGFVNQNTLALYLLSLIYACFVLFEPKLKTFLGLILIAAVGFFLSGSRGLVLGLFSLISTFYIFKASNPTFRRFIVFLFPLIVICDLVFLYQFSYGPIEAYFDKLSSYRFSYVCRVIQELPITFFGDPSFFTEDSDPFDNCYAWCLLVFGIVGTTVFLLSVFLGLLKHVDNITLLSICSTICLIGFIESRMSDPVMSFPIIKILLDGWDTQFLKNEFAQIAKT